MISDFLLGLFDRNLFFEKLLLSVDEMQEFISKSVGRVHTIGTNAFEWIKRLIKWSAISLVISVLAAISLTLSVNCNGPTWLNLVFLALSGIFALTGMILLAPIAMIMQPAIDAFPSLKQSLKKYPGAIASGAFLILFALIFYWKLQIIFSPGTATGVLFIMLVIALGSASGWIALPPKKLKAVITIQLFTCLFFIVGLALLPRFLPAAGRWMRHNETSAANKLDDEISSLVKIDPEAPPIMFNADGSPRFSFTKTQEGAFRVFPSDVQYDPYTGQKTAPIDGIEIQNKVFTQIRHDEDIKVTQEKIAAQEAMKNERKLANIIAEREMSEKRAHIAAYVADNELINRPGTREIAIVVRDESGKTIDAMATAIANSLTKRDGTIVSTSFFSDSFFKDGLFDKVIADGERQLGPLNLAERADFIIFAKYSSNTTKTGHGDLLSDKAKLSIHVISTTGSRLLESFDLNEAGVGMRQDLAEKMVIERIAAQFAEHEKAANW